MAAYTTINNPELYFQVKIWSGDGTAIGSGGQAITLDGDENMQPDMVYLKRRDHTNAGQIHDAVRGATKFMPMDGSTDAEETNTETLTAFNSDGFTVGNHNGVNNASGTYVAWCWKESADAGFDIVSYTGNNTNRTISHSLSAVPHWMAFMERTEAGNRVVYHHKNTSAPETDLLLWNTTAATADDDSAWNDTAPTSSVFTLGDGDGGGDNNNNTITYVGYLWSEKQGYSKFGSYVGNGNNDGTSVNVGFAPAFVMIKKFNASGTSWVIFDNKRNTFNERSRIIQTNDTGAEESSANRIDFNSNGFKLRGTWTVINASGASYVYMAFAESPFVNSNGVPNNAG
tara:strand:+ start:156 stop:1184 length:1029 start_codon:yes stop_codon:yes gene_type:complete